MSMFTRAFPKWLPTAVAVTLVLLLSYTFAQQVYRMSANDPQVMLANDTAARLVAGTPASALVASPTVDPSKSLAPFITVLDDSGKVVASSMQIGSATPVPPAGVLDTAKATGEYKVTWQPHADTRIAAVVVPVKGGPGGFVVAGRSLEEVEQREDDLTKMAGLGWLGTMALTLMAAVVAVWLEDRVSSPA
jgi:hypothetical protein